MLYQPGHPEEPKDPAYVNPAGTLWGGPGRTYKSWEGVPTKSGETTPYFERPGVKAQQKELERQIQKFGGPLTRMRRADEEVATDSDAIIEELRFILDAK
jgi:hypothetical protein